MNILLITGNAEFISQIICDLVVQCIDLVNCSFTDCWRNGSLIVIDDIFECRQSGSIILEIIKVLPFCQSSI